MMRLVTRSDFDGLVCAMILKELGLIEEIKFVHPKDVQDGKVELTSNDITTNLPYDPRVGLCFDHHESELARNSDAVKSSIIITKKMITCIESPMRSCWLLTREILRTSR